MTDTETYTPSSLWSKAADKMRPRPHPYSDDVVGWLRSKLREDTWTKEREILEALREHRYVAVQSCHDVGKSYTASRKVAHWIETHPVGTAFAVTTAPTDPQVKAILWREIGRAHRKGNLIGRITLDAQWKIVHGLGPDELVAYGRKPSDYEPSAFQGIHAEFVLIVIDEAGGVSKAIFEAADSLMTNQSARMLAIGNPDDPSTHFSEICKPGSGWFVIRIDGLESPNFTRKEVAKFPELRKYMIKEGVPPSTEHVPTSMRPLLLSPEWVSERIKRWGISSPMFQSKVRGKFPHIGIDTLIEPRWVTAAQIREQPRDSTDPRLGVDVARYGDDHTIIGLRLGYHFRVIHDIARGPTTETAGLVQQVGLPLPIRPTANVDDTGVGGGVTDMLTSSGYPVLPLISNARCVEMLPNGKPRFVNARSEWWWHLRMILAGPSGTGEDGFLDLDPLDDDLASQIQSIKYTINQHGQIKVETKDEMKARGLPSPDRGDALVYSLVVWSNPEQPTGNLPLTGDLMAAEW